MRRVMLREIGSRERDREGEGAGMGVWILEPVCIAYATREAACAGGEAA